MSYRPRKTHGSIESSIGKSTRLSRIAQPIRGASLRQRSLERTSSADQLNNAAYSMASATKRNRSSSATPLRTPNRPIPHPGVGVLMTSEKERIPIDDKKFLQAQAIRVTEYLHGVDDILGKEFFQRGGLKSMSTKQFIAIFSHLLKFVVGTRLSIGTNYIDDIVTVLTQIEYPYTVNKSWLKTPSAPHAFNNVIILFGWLLDFVPRQESVEEFEREYLRVDNDFLNEEYALKFNSSAKLGFSLWNNSKNEEFNNLKKEIMNSFIEKRVRLEQVESSLEGLELHISRLSIELDDLAKIKGENKRKLFMAEKNCKQLEDQLIRKKNNLVKMEKICNENQQNISRLEDLAKQKQRQITETQCRIDCIETSIKAQGMTTNERAELIEHLQYLKQLLDSNKKATNQLQDKYESYQVLYSRLMKRTLDIVTAFNTQLQQIFADQSDLTSMKVEDLLLDRNSDIPLEEQLERVVPLLEKLKQSAFQQMKVYTLKISEDEQKLKRAVYEFNTLLEEQLQRVLLKCDEYSKSIEKLDESILNASGELNKKFSETSQILKDRVAINAELRERISVKRKEIVTLKDENKEIIALVTEKMDKHLQTRKRNVEALSEDVKELWRVLEEIMLKLKDLG